MNVLQVTLAALPMSPKNIQQCDPSRNKEEEYTLKIKHALVRTLRSSPASAIMRMRVASIVPAWLRSWAANEGGAARMICVALN